MQLIEVRSAAGVAINLSVMQRIAQQLLTLARSEHREILRAVIDGSLNIHAALGKVAPVIRRRRDEHSAIQLLHERTGDHGGGARQIMDGSRGNALVPDRDSKSSPAMNGLQEFIEELICDVRRHEHITMHLTKAVEHLNEANRWHETLEAAARSRRTGEATAELRASRAARIS